MHSSQYLPTFTILLQMVCYDVILLDDIISSEFPLNSRKTEIDQEVGHVGRQREKVFKKTLMHMLEHKINFLTFCLPK